MVNDDFSKLDFDIICQAANESDKFAYNLIDKMGQNLGEGIVTIINLFNPARIITWWKDTMCKKPYHKFNNEYCTKKSSRNTTKKYRNSLF